VIIDDLIELLERHGSERYGGEAVNQRQHALQCATLAEADGCAPSLVAATLLHDIGHLVHHLGEDCASRGIDDAHEYRGERLLAEHFLPAVVEPVRLHVEAKRYLCYAEDGYWDALSPASKRSLELQGGPFNAHQAEAFLCHDHAEDAVQLRRYDERGKDPALQTPDVAHFRPQLQANLLTSRTT